MVSGLTLMNCCTAKHVFFSSFKNETYLVYNESENGWNINFGYFGFEVSICTFSCLGQTEAYSLKCLGLTISLFWCMALFQGTR